MTTGSPLQAVKFALSLQYEMDTREFLKSWEEGDAANWEDAAGTSFEAFCAAHPDQPEHLGTDGTVRKDHYGAGKQPWDTTKELGWHPYAAAFNVLKYLRRSKEPEHSLKSARWYYHELQKAAHPSEHNPTAQGVLTQLHFELTPVEKERLRP